MEPGGAPFINFAFILTLGKTKRGRINVPVMFIHISTETSCPRSAETNPPTCRLPVLAKTFEGLPFTVVMPVSSQLKIRCGGNLYLSITASNRSKNLLTIWGWKDVALAAEVASGSLKNSFLCRCINPCSQSLPGFLLALLKEFSELFFSAS